MRAWSRPGVERADLLIPPAGPGEAIALFGGSFNPPHSGHRHVADVAMRRLGVSRVWWIVTPANPLKSEDGLAPLGSRVSWTRDVAHHRRMIVTAFEAAVGTRFSADTLTLLKRRFPATRFVFVIGADNLATLHHWMEWRRIMITFPLAVIDRPGASLRALSSPAALAFARYRQPEHWAKRLARADAPAWVFLHAPLEPTSSTALRGAGQPLS
ncbi:MAG: nicotinate-nucleotide adenylyltransferase [Pseudomonadota bacterium]